MEYLRMLLKNYQSNRKLQYDLRQNIEAAKSMEDELFKIIVMALGSDIENEIVNTIVYHENDHGDFNVNDCVEDLLELIKNRKSQFDLKVESIDSVD